MIAKIENEKEESFRSSNFYWKSPNLDSPLILRVSSALVYLFCICSTKYVSEILMLQNTKENEYDLENVSTLLRLKLTCDFSLLKT